MSIPPIPVPGARPEPNPFGGLTTEQHAYELARAMLEREIEAAARAIGERVARDYRRPVAFRTLLRVVPTPNGYEIRLNLVLPPK